MSDKITNKELSKVSGGANVYNYYTVKFGNTLASISAYLRVSQSTLIKLNNISNPDKIKVGDRLKYPA